MTHFTEVTSPHLLAPPCLRNAGDKVSCDLPALRPNTTRVTSECGRGPEPPGALLCSSAGASWHLMLLLLLLPWAHPLAFPRRG